MNRAGRVIPLTTMPSPLSDSIYHITLVIDWENIRVAEAARCTAMLAELGRQIEAFSIADPPRSATSR